MKCCAGFFAHTVILHLIFPLVKTCIAITNVVLDDHVLRSSGNYQLFQLSFSTMLDFYIGKILGTRLSEVSGVTKSAILHVFLKNCLQGIGRIGYPYFPVVLLLCKSSEADPSLFLFLEHWFYVFLWFASVHAGIRMTCKVDIFV